MTPEQMETTVKLVSVLWPNPRQDMERLTAGYVLLLADRDVDEVEAAIRRLAIGGREWAPPPGVVAEEMIGYAKQQGVVRMLQDHSMRHINER